MLSRGYSLKYKYMNIFTHIDIKSQVRNVYAEKSRVAQKSPIHQIFREKALKYC